MKTKPLTQFPGKNEGWGNQKDQAFEKLKMALASKPVLQIYNPNSRCTKSSADADAPEGASVLRHEDADSELHPVYMLSRRTSEAEAKSHSSKLELLRMVWAAERLCDVRRMHPYQGITQASELPPIPPARHPFAVVHLHLELLVTSRESNPYM